MKKQVIYPGTFDPITYGHIDIIKRCLKMSEQVVVAVAENKDKNPLFSVEERIAMVKTSIQDLKGVSVESFSGLLVDYAKKKRIVAVVRGLRAISDFEYEFQMALTNRKLCEDVETIFLMPHEKYSYVSSRTIKEVCKLGGDVHEFVPDSVENALQEKFKSSG